MAGNDKLLVFITIAAIAIAAFSLMPQLDQDVQNITDMNPQNVTTGQGQNGTGNLTEAGQDRGVGQTQNSSSSVALPEDSARVLFCPRDDCEQAASIEFALAKSSIDAAIYSFTSHGLEQALLEAERRGVKVRVVADYTQSASGSSVVKWLDGNGIDTRIYPKGTTMHDKFAVIDNKTILTGSYNWTWNGSEKNRENLIIINSGQLAKEYGDEFFRLWAEAG